MVMNRFYNENEINKFGILSLQNQTYINSFFNEEGKVKIFNADKHLDYLNFLKKEIEMD